MLLAFVFVLSMGGFTVFADEVDPVAGTIAISVVPTYLEDCSAVYDVTVTAGGFSDGLHSLRAYYFDVPADAAVAANYVDTMEGNIDNLDQFEGVGATWEFPSRFDDWVYGCAIVAFVDNQSQILNVELPEYEVSGSLIINQRAIDYDVSNFGTVKDGAGEFVVSDSTGVVWRTPIKNGDSLMHHVSPNNWIGDVTLDFYIDGEFIETLYSSADDGVDPQPPQEFDVVADILGIDGGVVNQAAQGVTYEISGYDRFRDGNYVLAIYNNGSEVPGTRIIINRDTDAPVTVLLPNVKWAPTLVELRVLNLDEDGAILSYAINARVTINPINYTTVNTLIVTPTSLTPRVGGTGTLTAITMPATGTIEYAWVSSDLTIVTVASIPNTNQATFRAVRAGTATITVDVNAGMVSRAVTVRVAP
jgi:hypothetical protein